MVLGTLGNLDGDLGIDLVGRGRTRSSDRGLAHDWRRRTGELEVSMNMSMSMVAAGHWEVISADSRQRSDAAFDPNGGVVESDDKVKRCVSGGCGKTVKGDSNLCRNLNGIKLFLRVPGSPRGFD